VIADDGSKEETRALIAEREGEFGGRLKHVWHEDKGNRKAAICNEAVRSSEAPYLLFIDGDSVPHSRWIEDHRKGARAGRVLCGRRVKLGPVLSEEMNREIVSSGVLEAWFGRVFRSAVSGDTQRWSLGLRLPSGLCRVLHPRKRKLMGVNFSLPREAFERVNGYDENWSTRRQDRDLDLRLNRGGFEMYPFLNRGVVFHMHHESRKPDAQTEDRVREEEKSDRVRCEVGLDRGAPS
jgi:cellulose synthase/poly-beta-1,6-N-acetylglucosamine synthase-like glycosyltransferase